MVSALFCPEVFLFIALNQRASAHAVLEQATKSLPVRTRASLRDARTNSKKDWANDSVESELGALKVRLG